MKDLIHTLVSQNTLMTVMDNVGAYIYIKDLAGRYLYVNRKVKVLFGVDEEEIIGQHDESFFDLERASELKEHDELVMSSCQVVECEERTYVKAIDSTIIFWSVKKPLYDENNNVVGMFGISTDITERKRLEKKLREQNALLSILMDNIDSAVYMMDRQGQIIYGNRRLAERFGLDEHELQEMPISELVDADTLVNLQQNNRAVFSSGETQRFKESVVYANGEEHVFWSVKVPLRLANEEQVIVGFSTEMTDVFALQEKLRIQSIEDELTGLFNRRYYFQQGEKSFATAKGKKQTSSFLVMDLDNFKDINDEYGHLSGDEVLTQVAQVLSQCLGKQHLLARVGGEEFAALMHTDLQKAVSMAEAIRTTLADISVTLTCGRAISVTMSIGVFADEMSKNDFVDNYGYADKLLYDAKNQGRNRVCSAASACMGRSA